MTARLRSRLPRRGDEQVERSFLLRRGRRVRVLAGAVVVRRRLRLVDVAALRLARLGVAAVLELVLLALVAAVLRLLRLGGTARSSPRAVASPVAASPPTPFCDCSFDWPVLLAFPAQASPELLPFDWSTSPDLQERARQTGTAAFTGSTCTAFDSAVASCDVLFELDADWD